MTQAQSDLVRQFKSGIEAEDIEDASNMAVEETDESGYDAILVGYGHAVYAARRDDGTFVQYDGWKGRSISTNTHLGKIRYKLDNQNIETEGRPGRGHFPEYDDQRRAVL
jgi:hypothetical protein